MDGYTPTTEEVRDAWGAAILDGATSAESRLATSYGDSALADAMFDRWLASVRADAWDEGNRARTEYERTIVAAYLDDGADYIEAPVNPYRGEKQ